LQGIVRQHLYSGLGNILRQALLRPDALDGTSATFSLIDVCGELVYSQLSAAFSTSDSSMCPFVLKRCLTVEGEVLEPLPHLIRFAFSILISIEYAKHESHSNIRVEHRWWASIRETLSKVVNHIW
jgi:hypothetical protein